jgi:putative zinc finger/helix-turn-helix YgiT family protein
MCDNNKQLKSASITHRYRESGLDNIILHGVKETRCDECGEVYYNFGDIDALHQMIAQQLIVKSDDLTGPEVRFLRKFLGYSSGVFAKLVGYEIEHLSRLENGKTPVQKTFDHLVRLMVAKKIPDRDYDLQDLFLDGKAVKLEWLEFALKGKDWRPAKAG